MPTKKQRRWRTLLNKLTQPTYICKACLRQCYRQSTFHLFHGSDLCEECYLKMNPTWHNFQVNTIKGLALYPYNEFIKEKIFLLKGCGDIEMADIFLDHVRAMLKLLYRGYYIICVPSWEADNQKRGYNHVQVIFKALNLPFLDILQKRVPFKQSSNSLKNRQQLDDKFVIDANISLQNKKVLLVDDITTSGATLKACSSLIAQKHPRQLKILTIAFVEKRKN